jgi:hypothetical protein
LIGALVDAPPKTETYDGDNPTSVVKARVEVLLTALAFGTSGRYEVEQRVGGNPSDNSKADYQARIDTGEAALVQAFGGKVDALLGTVAGHPRVTANPTAREGFEKLGTTTGTLTVPTVTMHTEYDPLVLVQNERVLANRVQAKNHSGNLVQLYIAPPSTYSEATGAPFGAGHCVFTDQQRAALISTLDSWVRLRVYPIPSGLGALFGAGLDPVYIPGSWPTGAAE